MEVPVFVLTGGDPLKRPDIFELVRYASEHNVRISLTPSATPLLTRENIVQLKAVRTGAAGGVARWPDGGDSRRLPTGERFVRVDAECRKVGARDRLAGADQHHHHAPQSFATGRHHRSAQTLDIVLWSVFFLVPTGRGQSIDLISAEEFEQVFQKLYETSQRVMFDIKSTEAQHYRRFLLQRRTESRRSDSGLPPEFSRIPQYAQMPMGMETPDGIGRAPRGINDGKGFVFISHLGEVFPSGFLPVSGGNVRKQSLSEIYRNSPLFRSLRDSKNLEGKCGQCEFREICGGSRARTLCADRKHVRRRAVLCV